MGLEEIAATTEELKAAMRKAAEDQIRPALLEEVEKLAANFPELEKLRWTQYTPYFNDGDTCYFGFHGLQYKLKEDEESGDYGDGFEYASSYGDSTQIEKAVAELSSRLNKLKDALEIAFGDHAEVTIDIATKEITVEEYEHD